MNFRIPFFSILIILLFSTCEKYEDIVGYNEYFIEKGRHSSKGKSFDELTNTVLTYDVIFDESAKYKINDADQADINKLFGFSDCNSNHQSNSARFGWRWYNDQLEILSYNYVNGKRTFEFLTTVDFHQPYRFSIKLDGSKYVFTIEDQLEPTYYERGNVCHKGLHYLLFPYFGGNIEAPHDIKIFMRRIY
jgi:hypothetical protein